jgi:phosphoketolase
MGTLTLTLTLTLTPELLYKMDAYWRAANYLSVGQIYLYDNPLLRGPLAPADVKQMLLGHWGTTPACCSATCACRIFASTRLTCPPRVRPASATPMCSDPSCVMWQS